MSLRSVLRTLVLAVVVLCVIVAGAVAFGVVDRPSVAATESRFASVNASTTVAETDVIVANPNPVGVRLSNATVGHTIAMNGIEMGAATTEGFRLTTGNTTIGLTTPIDNRRIPAWWASHVRNGERTRLVATARVRSSLLGRTATVRETEVVETGITDAFNSTEPRPVNASLPLIDDPVLVVDRTSATWGDVTEGTTTLSSDIVVSNPKSIPYPISRIEYEIAMNDVTVGNGTTARGYTIPAEGRETIRADVTIDNGELDEWWVSHLERGQRTDLRVDLTAVVELPDGETARLPLDGLGYDTTIETDVLDDG
ncbi:LEA type 2 family protein [Halococcus agarilyticus]|uniref:LEA type 2 family protein n=1 Tax=Halococcus agarilyticus TaxID=1232219 RepID=UPI000677662D|nr:LEA type 2 family protein [Halococcus agarilyticus]